MHACLSMQNPFGNARHGMFCWGPPCFVDRVGLNQVQARLRCCMTGNMLMHHGHGPSRVAHFVFPHESLGQCLRAWHPCAGLRALKLGLSGLRSLALGLPNLVALDLHACHELRCLVLDCPNLLSLSCHACRCAARASLLMSGRAPVCQTACQPCRGCWLVGCRLLFVMCTAVREQPVLTLGGS